MSDNLFLGDTTYPHLPDVEHLKSHIKELEEKQETFKLTIKDLSETCAEQKEQIERKNVYLEATLQLFKKVDDSPYVKNVLYETAYYDEAKCDGFCLASEIALDLGFDEFGGYKDVKDGVK